MLQNNKQLNILMLLSAFYVFFFSKKGEKHAFFYFWYLCTFCHLPWSQACMNKHKSRHCFGSWRWCDRRREKHCTRWYLKKKWKKKKQSDAERYMNLSKLAVLMLKKMHVFCQFRSRVFEKLESITGTQEAVIKTMIIILVPLHVLPFPLKPGLHKQT